MLLLDGERKFIFRKENEYNVSSDLWEGYKKFPIPSQVRWGLPDGTGYNDVVPSCSHNYGFCNYYRVGNGDFPSTGYMRAHSFRVTNDVVSVNDAFKYLKDPDIMGDDYPEYLIALDYNPTLKVQGPIYDIIDPYIKRETVNLYDRDSHSLVQQQRVMKNVEAIAIKVNNLNFSTYFGHAAVLACKHCFPTGIVNTGGEFNMGDNLYSAYVKKNYGDKVQYSNESHQIGIINDYDIWVIGNTGLPVSSTSSDLDESKITLSTERGVCGAIPRLLFGIDAVGQKNFEFALLYQEMEISQNHLRSR